MTISSYLFLMISSDSLTETLLLGYNDSKEGGMDMEADILVVDDEPEIADLVEVYLKSEGFTVYTCGTAAQALEHVGSHAVDLALLDVMLPDMSGFILCGEIRKEHHFPVIMLTAKTGDMDKITGLTIGADDYITKPFNPVVLGAKIKALIRRNQKVAYSAHNYITAGPFRYSNMTLEFFKNDQLIQLSSKENVMIKLFISNIGRVFTKEQLYELVWGNSFVDENAIMVYINRLRNKIEDNPKTPHYIKTVWGLGYKFTVDE